MIVDVILIRGDEETIQRLYDDVNGENPVGNAYEQLSSILVNDGELLFFFV